MTPHPKRMFEILAILLAGTLILASASAQDSASFQMVQTAAGLSLHKDMFMLPVTFSDEYHGARTEAVFQISAKYRLLKTPIYFAFTQISFWQAYDADNSAPFRETDYNPEIFLRPNTVPLWGGQAGTDLGLEHESNGQRAPISRSWNLLYASPYWYRSNLLIYLKLRHRFPEEEKDSLGASLGDDNPDITDYLGYSDLHVYYRFPWQHSIHMMVRGNFNTGRGGLSAIYAIPIPGSTLSNFVLRISQGHGESLVDYKKELFRIGVGIMFAQ